MANTTKGASGLSKMAENVILDDLKNAVITQARTSTFACGGSVDIKADSPVQIRFGEQGEGELVNLPADTIESKPLQKLVSTCT
jgi:hypothetical protein